MKKKSIFIFTIVSMLRVYNLYSFNEVEVNNPKVLKTIQEVFQGASYKVIGKNNLGIDNSMVYLVVSEYHPEKYLYAFTKMMVVREDGKISNYYDIEKFILYNYIYKKLDILDFKFHGFYSKNKIEYFYFEENINFQNDKLCFIYAVDQKNNLIINKTFFSFVISQEDKNGIIGEFSVDDGIRAKIDGFYQEYIKNKQNKVLLKSKVVYRK